MDFDLDAWRDTVVVPPNGRTHIWVRYKNYTGKEIFALSLSRTRVLVTGLTGLAYLVTRKDTYEAVAMNELKSKVND